MKKLRRLVARSLAGMGIHDYCLTATEAWFRLLRMIGLGVNTRFFLTPGVSFLIRKEKEFVFQHFTRNGHLLADMKVFLEMAESRTTFLDVGALYGVYSLAFCTLSGKRKAYALEPSPIAFKTLQYHKAINERSPDIFNVGFGKAEGKLRMRYEWVQLEIVNDDAPYDFAAPITTLDKFVEDHGIQPDIIKIDTEGSEYDIFLGARIYLERNHPIILLEVHVRWLETLGRSLEDLYALIQAIGYQVFDLNRTRIENPARYRYPSDPYTVLLAKE